MKILTALVVILISGTLGGALCVIGMDAQVLRTLILRKPAAPPEPVPVLNMPREERDAQDASMLTEPAPAPDVVPPPKPAPLACPAMPVTGTIETVDHLMWVYAAKHWRCVGAAKRGSSR